MLSDHHVPQGALHLHQVDQMGLQELKIPREQSQRYFQASVNCFAFVLCTMLTEQGNCLVPVVTLSDLLLEINVKMIFLAFLVAGAISCLIIF